MAKRSAYYKTNLSWPVERVSTGFKKVQLAQRYEAALRHLIRTPKGSLLVDSGYGTDFYRMRAQIISDQDLGLAQESFKLAAGKYIPDILIHEMVGDMDHENHKLIIKAIWTIQGADPAMHGDLGTPKETQVLI